MLVWLWFYVFYIAQQFLRYRKILNLISILKNYAEIANPQKIKRYYEESYFINETPEYHNEVERVLSFYPQIRELITNSYYYLSYTQDALEFYRNVSYFHNALKLDSHYAKHNLKKAFNPFASLKILLSLPSAFLKWIGFNPSRLVSAIVNLFGGIVGFLIGLYSAEIKELIATLFQNLANH